MYRLIVDLILLVIASLSFGFLEIKTNFSKLSYTIRQIIIGIVFGILAIIFSIYGLNKNDIIVNIRDAAPLTAGLLFGGPAGIIAGIIGGSYRFLSIYWGGATFTRYACSLATMIAGLISALLRKTIFNNKHPNVFFSFAIGVAVEVFHMLLILLLNMNKMSQAFQYVSFCADVMIVGNGIALALCVFLVEKFIDKRKRTKIRPMPLLDKFSISLFIFVIVMLLFTGTVTFLVNTSLARSEAQTLLESNVGDLLDDLNLYGSSDYISNWRIGQTGGVIVARADTGEVLFVTKDGSSVDIETFSFIRDIKEENELYIAELNGEEIYAESTYDDDYIIIAYIPTDEANLSRNVTLYMTIFMEVLIFIAFFFVVYQIVRNQITHPLHGVNNGLKDISDGKLDTVIDVRNNIEFSNLSDDVNTTVDSLKELIKDAKKRVERELELAHDIQKSAVPSSEQFSKQNDFDIYALMNTAKEVGGDFYDFHFIDHNNFAFLIADVSGKGIPAAMFMMGAKTLIKGLADKRKPIDEVFWETNNSLCQGNDTGMFVTAWMGIINLETGHLTYANAGHNPPLVYRRNGQFEYLKDKANFILAGMENSSYTRHELDLNPGDMLYLYTDGVTEADNSEHVLYGEDRLKDILNKSFDKSSSEICQAVLEDVKNYAGNAEQSDDITMLCFKLKQIQSLNSISVYPSKESLGLVSEYVENKLATLKISQSVRNKVQITVDEIFSNIEKYGKASKVTISFNFKNEQLELKFIDNGDKFNPIEEKDPDITLSAEERKIGGLGIYMVKNLSSSCTYEYVDNQNHLNVVFDLRNA